MSAAGEVARNAAAQMRAIADIIEHDAQSLTAWSFNAHEGRVTIKLSATYTDALISLMRSQLSESRMTSTREIADALGVKL